MEIGPKQRMHTRVHSEETHIPFLLKEDVMQYIQAICTSANGPTHTNTGLR